MNHRTFGRLGWEVGEVAGMRREEHVRANSAASAAGPLPADLIDRLREHRWDRVPTQWSQ